MTVHFQNQNMPQEVYLLAERIPPPDGELARVISANQHLGQRASALASERDAVRAELENASRNVRALQSSLSILHEYYDQILIDMQTQLSVFQTQLSDEQARHAEQVKALAERDERIEALEESWQAQIAELEQRVEAAEDERATAAVQARSPLGAALAEATQYAIRKAPMHLPV